MRSQHTNVNKAILPIGKFLYTEKTDPLRGHFSEVIVGDMASGVLSRKKLKALGLTEDQIKAAENGEPTNVSEEIRYRIIFATLKASRHMLGISEKQAVRPLSDIDWALD